MASTIATAANADRSNIGKRLGADDVVTTSSIVLRLNKGMLLSTDRTWLRSVLATAVGAPLVLITRVKLPQLASCANGTYICAVASESSDAFVSPTTPTISRGNFSSAVKVMRRPTG